jgi:hypothetical protein
MEKIDFSKNKLKNSNMACLNNCSFIFESLCQNNNLDLPDILKAIINDSKQPDYAPDMFHRANLLFWDKIKYNKKRELICLDHRFFCDIIAENILKNTPIINAILFDKIKRRSFLSVKEKIIQSEKNLVLRNTTDFFYLKKGDELIPLKIGGGGYFYSGRSGKVAFTSNKKLSLDREIIYEALKSRDLYPDLILSNIFGHILPKIIAIGGTSQLEYLPNIVRILKEFLAINDISDDFGCENKKIDETDYGRLIGPGLIKFTESDREFISRLNSQSDLDEFVNSFCDKKIGDVLNIDFWSYFNIFYQRKRNRKD